MPTRFDTLLQTARYLETLTEGYATRDSGDAYSLYDANLGEMFRDDDFNGGAIFLKSNQQASGTHAATNESMGTLDGSYLLVKRVSHQPITPGSVTVEYGATYENSVADSDANGILAETDTWSAGTATIRADEAASGEGPFVLGKRNIRPGSVYIEASLGPAFLIQDDGNGHLYNALTGVRWATIDYTYGVITRVTDAALAPAYTASGFDYYNLSGTINYTTGDITIVMSDVQTALPFRVSYQYGYDLFIPIILNVTNFTSNSGRIEFSPDVLNVTVNKGDLYGVMPKRYPASLLRQKLNETLREIKAETEVLAGDPPGYIPCSDLVNGQLAWTDTRHIQRIEVGRNQTVDRQWQPVTRWSLSGGILRFNDPALPTTSDFVLRITVVDSLADLDSDGDDIPNRYPVEWLALETALKCARWRLFQPGKDDKQLTILINDLMSRRDKSRARSHHIEPRPFSWQTAQEWPEC